MSKIARQVHHDRAAHRHTVDMWWFDFLQIWAAVAATARHEITMSKIAALDERARALLATQGIRWAPVGSA